MSRFWVSYLIAVFIAVMTYVAMLRLRMKPGFRWLARPISRPDPLLLAMPRSWVVTWGEILVYTIWLAAFMMATLAQIIR